MSKAPPPTVVIDTREKQPWIFEHDDVFQDVIREGLPTGDYTLVEMKDLLAIERKKSADELFLNLSSKKMKDRFYREMERLSEFKFKFIIVESTLEEALTPTHYYINRGKGRNRFSPHMPGALVTEQCINIMNKFGIPVIFAGNRAKYFARKIMLESYDQFVKENDS
jgi:ERCC4-type nuclease